MSELCVLCGKLFGHKQALAKHLKWKHTRTIGKYKCNKCNKRFHNIKSLGNHNRAHIQGTVRSRDAYVCPLCRSNFDKSNIYAHFVYSHNIEISIQSLIFKSMDLFDKWKKDLELKTIARYTKRRSSATNKDGSISSQFYCHRDGYFRPRGSGLRSLKRIGSNRIDGHCPSMMEVNQINGTVYVNFTKTHVGHSSDLDRLKPVQKENIVKQLATEDSVKDTAYLPVAGTETPVKDTHELSVANTEISVENAHQISVAATNTSVEVTHQLFVAATERLGENIHQLLETEEESFSVARTEEVQCGDDSNNLVIDCATQDYSDSEQPNMLNSVENVHHNLLTSESKLEDFSERLGEITKVQYVGSSNDLVATQIKLVDSQLVVNNSVEDGHQFSNSELEKEIEFSKRKANILEINFNVFKELIQSEDQLHAFITYANATKHLIRRLETKEKNHLKRKKTLLNDSSNKKSVLKKNIFSKCTTNVNEVEQLVKPPQIKINPIRHLQNKSFLQSEESTYEKEHKCKLVGISCSNNLHDIFDHSYASVLCQQVDQI